MNFVFYIDISTNIKIYCYNINNNLNVYFVASAIGKGAVGATLPSVNVRRICRGSRHIIICSKTLQF